ncbi:transport and Golgi organization protein 6 homolog [Anneissia japonica]|uniref:transport and Golgi organization protein 6 homolog n=1 Tax=Anneissia japonica TaxID=1529436 RepID=UPI0014256982|nr:transport and Golgi organization protein 6 homolog [Anneissia japonica]
MATYSSRDVLEAMELLISPVQQQSQSEKSDGLSMVFQINLKRLHDRIKQEQYSESELHLHLPVCKEVQTSLEWSAIYLETCLQLLLCLKQSLQKVEEKKENKRDENFKHKRPHDCAPPLSPATLSINDQKVVTTLTQFIVCLGIAPNLDAGVGIPLSMRSDFSVLLSKTSISSDLSLESENQNLARVMRKLLDSTDLAALGGIILSKYLNDFLAALVQLSFKPQSSKAVGDAANLNKESASSITLPDPLSVEKGSSKHPEDHLEAAENASNLVGSSDTPNDHLVGSSGTPPVDRHVWRKELELLLNKLYQPMVIRELLLLQGGLSKRVKDRTKAKNPLPPAPVWLRKVCGKLLSERLMKPNGVHNVLCGILDSTGGGAADNWKQCEMIAKLLVNCPKQIHIATYYQNICPQVLDLVTCKDVLLMKKFLRIACCFISDVITRHQDLGQELLIKPLQHPLLKCIDADGILQSTPGSVFILEDSISTCVDSLHKVYVNGGSEPSQDLLQTIQPIIHPLFNLCVFLKDGISHLRSPVEDILHWYFKMTDTEISIRILKHLTLLKSDPLLGVMSPWLVFSPGSGGGAIVMVSEDKRSSETASVDVLGEQDVAATVLFEIIAKSKMNKLMGDFFIALLKELTNIVNGSTEESKKNTSEICADSKVLLQLKISQSDKLHSIQHALVVLNLVAKMCEEMGPAILKNKVQMIAFVEATLQRACNSMAGDGEDEECQDKSTMFEDETLSMALGLLTLIVADIKHVNTELKKMLTSLLPLLNIIGDQHRNKHLKEMSSSIRVTIATHGALKVDLPSDTDGQSIKKKLLPKGETKDSSSKCEGNGNKEDASSMVAEASCGNLEKNDPYSKLEVTPEGGSQTESDTDLVSESFDEAFKDLFDPLLPVRGHALIALGKLLRAKDPKSMQKKDILFRTFKEKLTDDDTYIYLAAIQGLEAMSDVFPDQVIPALCTEYANWEKKTTSDNEVRMKIGESLVKATRNLGELVPHFRHELLAAILTVTKDPDPDVCASSLANLGEVCKLLKFSLGSVIHEVLNCLVSILQTDNQVIVKRACVNVVTLILRGLGKEALTILESSLLNLYRTLKLTLRTESDDVVKLHAELALQEMDIFMREYLFPKQSLSKKIIVLP